MINRKQSKASVLAHDNARLDPDKVAELVLVITNDGPGSQCGYSYRSRCDFAIDGGSLHLPEFEHMAFSVAKWYGQNGDPCRFSLAEVKAAGLESRAYYIEHVKEF